MTTSTTRTAKDRYLAGELSVAEIATYLQAFREGAQALIDAAFNTPGSSTHVGDMADNRQLIHITGFRKFWKVTLAEGRPQPRVWAFIEIATGDVLMPAGYQVPATGARGNIFDDDHGLTYVTAYGPMYISDIKRGAAHVAMVKRAHAGRGE